MLNEVMDHFGLTRSLRHVGYFETEPHRQLLDGLKAALQEGELMACAGIVGSGKTTLLWRLQDLLKKEKSGCRYARDAFRPSCPRNALA